MDVVIIRKGIQKSWAKASKEKTDSMQEQIGNVNRETEILRKKQKGILDSKKK